MYLLQIEIMANTVEANNYYNGTVTRESAKFILLVGVFSI